MPSYINEVVRVRHEGPSGGISSLHVAFSCCLHEQHQGSGCVDECVTDMVHNGTTEMAPEVLDLVGQVNR